MGPAPLLSKEKASALLRQGRRSVGVLSYPWPTPGDPDPTGNRIAVMKRVLAENRHIEGFFWE